MPACSSCQAPIFWRSNTATGKGIPIDRDPVEGGRVVLVGDRQCRFLTKGESADVSTYASHFATCANRDQHRKPKTGA